MQLLNLSFTSVSSRSQAVSLITQTNRPLAVFTPNPEILLAAQTDAEFYNLLKKADILFPDGIGLYLAAQIADSRLPVVVKILLLPYYVLRLFLGRKGLYRQYGNRICGSDVTSDLLEYANIHHLSVAIVDAFTTDKDKSDSQKLVLPNLKKLFPHAKVYFYLHNGNNREELQHEIETSNANFLLVTLGMKKQEAFILDILPHLPNISAALGIGSSIDYFTGFQKRSPVWVSKLGFEWLYRLVCGRKKWNRLKRIYRAVVLFPLSVLYK